MLDIIKDLSSWERWMITTSNPEGIRHIILTGGVAPEYSPVEALLSKGLIEPFDRPHKSKSCALKLSDTGMKLKAAIMILDLRKED